jgi:hypothetical protein
MPTAAVAAAVARFEIDAKRNESQFGKENCENYMLLLIDVALLI